MRAAFDLSAAKLYTFVDTAYLNGRDPIEVTRQLCDGGSDLIQLRAKGATEAEVLGLAEKILPVTQAANVALVINDFPKVACQMGAQFCHLGQEDFFDRGYKAAKDVWAQAVPYPTSGTIGSPSPWPPPGGEGPKAPQLGLSTHGPSQAERAIGARPDYVAIGPVFPTLTKPAAAAVTLDYVRWATANVKIPWFAIGGINLNNLDQVLEAGATRICVVSAILNTPDIALACKRFRDRLRY